MRWFMKYLKSGQVVPGKGMAWTIYELNDSDEIQRIVTHIPEKNEVTLYRKPKMKSLFQPERLDESNEQEFSFVWDLGSK